MFVTNGSFAVALMLACVGTTFAIPSAAGEKQELSAKEHVANGTPQGRFLEPANFGVRSKKFTIGTVGVGRFFRAWRNCIDEGKSLATIDSEEEQRAIKQLIDDERTDYWIAATNLGSSSPPLSPSLTWITTDLPVKTIPNYFTPGTDVCIAINDRGRWKNKDCFDDKLPYICEEYF